MRDLPSGGATTAGKSKPSLIDRAIGRFRRLGIQIRIMLYVAVGLAAMVGLLVFFGLRALDEATDLVFEGRLSTARTMALIVERDFEHVRDDVRGVTAAWTYEAENGALESDVARLMEYLRVSDSFAFFHAAGIRVLDDSGRLLAAAGSDFSATISQAEAAAGATRSYTVFPGGDRAGVDVPFGVLAVRGDGGDAAPWFFVELVGHNSSAPFVPAEFGSTGAGPAGATPPDPSDSYRLEVVGPDGVVLLGIGEDEDVGQVSEHFDAIDTAGADGEAMVLRHRVDGRESVDDHVMGVVPLTGSDLTLVLEQPTDVALELPLLVRRRLLLWSGLGFLIALVLAWVTTKAVAKPAVELTDAAQRMASGDLDSPITVDARDEVGTLAESLESMRVQARAAYQAVEKANRELESRVQRRTAELGVLVERLISAQEEERYRLARELHDDTAQTLGALTIALDRARDASPNGVSEHLANAKDLASSLLEDTRRLILDLRPMVLDDMGLIPAIRWYAETRLGGQGIDWDLDVDGPQERLPAHVETALFRITQEAVNNVVKHAEASHTHLGISGNGNFVRIVVADDGRGFDADGKVDVADPGYHVGLAGMRERVSLLNGSMRIRSEIGHGTTVEVEVPLGEDGRVST